MSSDATPRLNIAVLPPTPAQPQVTHNEALVTIDALTDICLLGQFINAPPVSPSDGDTYLLGGAPTGVWSGQAYKLAYCLDGGWRFLAPFNGLRAYVAATRAFLVYLNGAWLDANALIGAAETSIASAATCDLGAAGALCVAITGTTPITSFGSGANLLRLVRFAGALTLTYNATSLILPGGASIVTTAGDTALLSSDGSGNWRCRDYMRAGGQPLSLPGTTTNDNAVAKQVGEFVDSEIASGAAVALTSGAPINVTSLALSAGDWDVWGLVTFHPGASTAISSLAGWVNTPSASYPGAPNKGGAGRTLFPAGFAPNDEATVGVFRRRYALAAATTVYLGAIGYFSVSTLSAYGYVAARRVR
jgi:hypothetical protein